MTKGMSSISYGRPIPNTVRFKPMHQFYGDNAVRHRKDGSRGEVHPWAFVWVRMPPRIPCDAPQIHDYAHRRASGRKTSTAEDTSLAGLLLS